MTAQRADRQHDLVLSVDLEEWFHSRRWVDGQQAVRIPDTAAFLRQYYGSDQPSGELVEPTRRILRLLRAHKATITFFVLGQVARWYPDLIREISDEGHEIASHGMYHVDMTVLGPAVFEQQLLEAADLQQRLTGSRPVGYRAPNLVYEPWATAILERAGFLYDGSVCASRPLGGKYRGWADAPTTPYHPDFQNVAKRGDARLVELPLPAFPVLKIAAGSGIVMRVFGFRWTYWALRHALRSGSSAFYFHPWELGQKPRPDGHWLKNQLFLRRTGDWMHTAVERIVREFSGRITGGRVAAEKHLAASGTVHGAWPDPAAAARRAGAVMTDLD